MHEQALCRARHVVDGEWMVALGGHCEVGFVGAELRQLGHAVGGHKTDAHDPCRDGEVIVHRADGPQYRGLHVLREQSIHSRSVPGRREVERAHEAAGREAGAADVCGHPAAAFSGEGRV